MEKELSDLRSRFKIFLRFLGVSLRAYAGDPTTEQRLTRQLSGKNSLSCDTVMKLLIENPDLSANWLFTGDGPMLKSQLNHINVDASDISISNNSGPVALKGGTANQNTSSSQDDLTKVISTLEKTIEQQQQLIDKLMEKL